MTYRVEMWLEDELVRVSEEAFPTVNKAWQYCWTIPEYRMFKSPYTFKVTENG